MFPYLLCEKSMLLIISPPFYIITSDWSSLAVYEPELVHDIIESEEEAYGEDEDSNG